MVSFRLPPEEYDQFREICLASGGNNVSQLLRTAVSRFLQDGRRLDSIEITLEHRVARLESQLHILLAELHPRPASTGDGHAMTATQP